MLAGSKLAKIVSEEKYTKQINTLSKKERTGGEKSQKLMNVLLRL